MSKRGKIPGGAGRTKRLRKKRLKWLQSNANDSRTVGKESAQPELLDNDLLERSVETCPQFFCPILREYGMGTGLIDGHILPQALKEAVRTTVVQRADVDNYFGHTLEPDLIDFLNSEAFTKAEFFKKAKNLTITVEGGTPARPFIAPPQSNPPFPRIVLKDQIEGIFASPFVKTTWENMGKTSGIARLEGDLSFSVPAVHGAIVKSAHLALCKLFDEWINGESGKFVADTLASFVRDKATKENATRYFSKFDGAFNFLWNETLPEDTLDGSLLLFHFEEGFHDIAHLFAMSCLFNVNKRTLIISLPYGMTDAEFSKSMAIYDAFRADRNMSQSVCVVRVTGKNSMDMQPISLKYHKPSSLQGVRPGTGDSIS